jgi:hypothetical protein
VCAIVVGLGEWDIACLRWGVRKMGIVMRKKTEECFGLSPAQSAGGNPSGHENHDMRVMRHLPSESGLRGTPAPSFSVPHPTSTSRRTRWDHGYSLLYTAHIKHHISIKTIARRNGMPVHILRSGIPSIGVTKMTRYLQIRSDRVPGS